jgi:hypothetical protein
VTRIDVVRSVVAAIGAQRYLEIGVRDGECFDAIAVPTRIAVDPQFRFRPPLRARLRTRLRRTTGTLYFALTSDAFFSAHGKRLAPLDVAFVDGLHTYEQAHRDVVHCLELLSDEGVVIVHDCSPRSEAAAAPTLATAARSEGFVGEWNGDVIRRSSACAPATTCASTFSTAIRGSESFGEEPRGFGSTCPCGTSRVSGTRTSIAIASGSSA